MATVAAVISAVAGVALAFGWMSGVAALIAGSIGAVVSVVQRINAGQFELDYDVGRPYAFFLGGLRPLIGGAFALAITFAFTSGLLHLPIQPKDPEAEPQAGGVRRRLPGRLQRALGPGHADDGAAVRGAAGPAPAKSPAQVAAEAEPPTP